MHFFKVLYKRGRLFFWYGWYNLFMSIICLGLLLFDKYKALNMEGWSKPFRYYLILCLLVWTINWMLYILNSKITKRILSIAILLSSFVYMGINFYQTNFGIVDVNSNLSSPQIKMFNLIIIVCQIVFLLAMISCTFFLFKVKKVPTSKHYTWGIRMGFLIFSLFALLGVLLTCSTSHLLGIQANDNVITLFKCNLKLKNLFFSKLLTVQSLQIIPLVSYFFFEKKSQVINFTIIYAILIVISIIFAFMNIPLLSF